MKNSEFWLIVSIKRNCVHILCYMGLAIVILLLALEIDHQSIVIEKLELNVVDLEYQLKIQNSSMHQRWSKRNNNDSFKSNMRR